MCQTAMATMLNHKANNTVQRYATAHQPALSPSVIDTISETAVDQLWLYLLAAGLQ